MARPRLLLVALAGFAGFAGATLLARSLSDSDESEGGPLDDYSPRELTQAGQCDPTPKKGPLLFRRWIKNAYGEQKVTAEKGIVNIVRDCKVGGPTEHWEGRAWDWMIPDAKTAESVIAMLLAPCPGGQGEHALLRRAGIMYMIYNRRMWRAYPHGAETRVWAPYNGPNPHTDHIHFSFSRKGAAGETSLYRMLEAGDPIA